MNRGRGFESVTKGLNFNKKHAMAIGCIVLLLASLEGIYLLSNTSENYENSHLLHGVEGEYKGQRLTYFLLDGLDFTVFHEELLAGNLPEFSKMIEEGVFIPRVVTSFPSMTGYGFWPLITGYDATQSGVMGLRWWDRSRTSGNMRNYLGPTNKNLNLDIKTYPKTVYERINEYSSTLQCYMNRGTSSNIQLKWMVVVTKYAAFFPLGPFRNIIRGIPLIGRYLLPNEIIGEEEMIDSAIKDLETNAPRVQWLTFGTPDGYRHSFGEEKQSYYRDIVRNCDHQIKKYREKCKELGGEELNRLFVVTSDHGVVNIQRHVNFETIMAKYGVQMYYGNSAYVLTSELDAPLSDFNGYDGVVAVNGNTLVHIYFRHDTNRTEANNKGWGGNKSCYQLQHYQKEGGKMVDIVDEFRYADGVELVICLNDFEPLNLPRREVHIYSKVGHSYIYVSDPAFTDENGNEIPINDIHNYDFNNPNVNFHYVVEDDEEDALGMFPRGSQTTLTADGWLSKTINDVYPYGPVRVWRAMVAPSSGDLIVTSLQGWDLAKEGYEIIVGENRGGHGGLRDDQMLVPVIISSHSNLKHRLKQNHVIPFSRSEDVGASLMNLVGVYDEELLLEKNNITDIHSNMQFANPNAIRGRRLDIQN